jgi:hypothetical protein
VVEPPDAGELSKPTMVLEEEYAPILVPSCAAPMAGEPEANV